MFDVVRGRSSAPTRLRPALLLSLLAHGVLLGTALLLSRPVPPPQGKDIRVSLPPASTRRGETTPGTALAQAHQVGPKRPPERHRLFRRPRPTTAAQTAEEPPGDVPDDLPGDGAERPGQGQDGVRGGPECATPPCGAGSDEGITDDVVADMPVLLSGPEVTLSPETRRSGVEGSVLVRCVITSLGTVEGCEVLKGLPLADAAVLAALQARRYRPARIDGRPVALRHLFTVKIRQAR